ncbi:Nucleic acid-binding protein [Desulfosarcina cetonica]|uniref:type II toxin-antitoxin system VapC family toxin n=1 Tax=Desulfosarcina cetonica TaxID=90730 RepID=UPI0006D068FC|nr:type II toxin-antitoxin system VapC family toxin [Desulfosarcina cetonica]VTR65922.1 Nucleic acid-binding protein [Desulfosarcina cetonica]
MNYLLDTCVISELVKPKPNRKVVGWISSQEEDHLFLSVLTLGEIQKGISKLSESNKKKTLRIWLQTDLLERFKGRILSVDEQVALDWGAIQATAEQNGILIPSIDGLIAATGIANNMTVVTRNVADMKPSGALLFNPWGKS